MTITVDIRPEVEAEITRQAASHGTEVEAYAASLLEDAICGPAEELAKTGMRKQAGRPSLPDAPEAEKGSRDDIDFSRHASALDWSQCAAVESVPGKVGCAWVFKNTRLPVAAVFENLEDGVAIDELVELYAGLTREQIAAVLDFAARSLAAPSLAG